MLRVYRSGRKESAGRSFGARSRARTQPGGQASASIGLAKWGVTWLKCQSGRGEGLAGCRRRSLQGPECDTAQEPVPTGPKGGYLPEHPRAGAPCSRGYRWPKLENATIPVTCLRGRQRGEEARECHDTPDNSLLKAGNLSSVTPNPPGNRCSSLCARHNSVVMCLSFLHDCLGSSLPLGSVAGKGINSCHTGVYCG